MSESAEDIVAEIMPAKRNPHIIGGMTSIARTGRAYLAPTFAKSDAENFPMLISASMIIPKIVGIKA